MSREIKFRGISQVSGEGFVYGCFHRIIIPNGLDTNITYDRHQIYNIETRITTDIEPHTLGQFTGLKDKNGVEIYQGDIVKATYIGRDIIERTAKFTIKFENYSFMLYNKFGYYGHLSCVHKAKLQWLIDTLEVIGNIYQHKHLLEEL